MIFWDLNVVFELTTDRRYMPETPARPKEVAKPVADTRSSGATYGNQKVSIVLPLLFL